MSRPVDSGGRSERQHSPPKHDTHSGHEKGDRDRQRSENDSSDRHSHRRREESARGKDSERKEEDSRDSEQSNSRRSHADSSEDDTRPSHSHRSKRARDGDQSADKDDDRRERKHKKHKKDKKHRHRHNDDRQPASELDQRIQHTKQRLALLSSSDPTAAASASASPAVLTADDYYARSAEFRLWLHNSRSLHLDELDGERARKLFDDFCTEWNGGRLPAVFYKGVDSSALSGDVLTGHKWGFVGRMSEEDKLANASVRDSVDTATHHRTYQQFAPASFTATAKTAPTAPSAAPTSSAAPTVSASTSRPFAALSKGEKRQHFRQVEAVMDEVAPRETGREARLLKKREAGEYSRRERGGDALDELDDDALLGGGGGESELARLKDRDRQRRESRNMEQAAKRSEWDRREKERMQAILQSIGQADKYKL